MQVYRYTSNFKTTYKKPLFIKVAIFSDIVLVSNYHGYKGEAIKLIPYYMIDITVKTKAITFEKIENHTKYNKHNVQVIFIFSD